MKNTNNIIKEDTIMANANNIINNIKEDTIMTNANSIINNIKEDNTMNNTTGTLTNLEVLCLKYAIKVIGIFSKDALDIIVKFTANDVFKAVNTAYTLLAATDADEDAKFSAFKTNVAAQLASSEDVLEVLKALDDDKLDAILYYCEDPSAAQDEYALQAIEQQQKEEALAKKQVKEVMQNTNSKQTTNKTMEVKGMSTKVATSVVGGKYTLANLNLSVLYKEVYVNSILNEAELDRRVQESADAKCEGNTAQVLSALYNSAASFKTHAKEYTDCTERTAFALAIRDFTNARKATAQSRVKHGTAVQDNSGRCKWDLTDEEIENCKGNLELINSTLRSLYDVKSKKYGEGYYLKKIDTERFEKFQRIEQIQEKLLKVKQETKKMLTCTTSNIEYLENNNPALLKKLQSKSSNVLTSQEMSDLLALLSKKN